jgi:hypothetical protein
MDHVNDPVGSGAGPVGDAAEEPARGEPVDLGTIVAREIPAEGSTPPPPGYTGASPGPTGSERTSTDASPVPFERRSLRSLLDQIRRGSSTMASDIVEARKGPVPNSRPVPEWVRGLAWLLDDSIPVGGGHRVGADGVASFIPGVGDAAGLVAGMVVVLAGIAAGVSIPTTLRMMLNVAVDTIVGAVPFLGSMFDLVFKSNTRNLRLIEADLADRAATRRSSIKVFLLSALVIAMSVFLFLFAVLGSLYLFYRFLLRVF